MKNTSLCYIEKDGKYLMLHRVKKQNDCNAGKWIGVGGKFEKDESPEECMIREVAEETGLRVTAWQFRGIVTFVSDTWETEHMYLFTADGFEGELSDCDEGELAWVEKSAVSALPIWEGDRLFLSLLERDEPFFLMKLCYEGDTLVQATLNGRKL